jgi:hypothetical protein
VLLIFVWGKIVLGAKVCSNFLYRLTTYIGYPHRHRVHQRSSLDDLGCSELMFWQFLDLSGNGLNHPLTFLVSRGLQVREEIYTPFNTIYTVLCEFRKP